MRKVILGIDDNFLAVPQWRFFPKYALDEKWDFEDDFALDPLNAQWNLDGQLFQYKADGNALSFMDPIPLNLANEDVVKEETWSFIGIKSGDVNFSARLSDDNIVISSSDNDIFKSNLPQMDENEELYLVFSLAGQSSTPNPTPEVWGYQFELQFDPQKLDVEGVFPTDNGIHPIEEDAFCIDQSNCTVRTLWYTNGNDVWNLPSMFQTQKLFAIKVKAKSNMQYGELGNYIQLNTDNYKNQFFDENLNVSPVNLDFGYIEPQNFKLQNIYPNPAQDVVNFVFQIQQGDSPIIITISDQFGNQISTTRYFSYFGQTTISMNTSSLGIGLLSAQIKIGQFQPFLRLITKVN